jgi:hypothetical protein
MDGGRMIAEGRPESSRPHRADLESVFLSLTGSDLQD